MSDNLQNKKELQDIPEENLKPWGENTALHDLFIILLSIAAILMSISLIKNSIIYHDQINLFYFVNPTTVSGDSYPDNSIDTTITVGHDSSTGEETDYVNEAFKKFNEATAPFFLLLKILCGVAPVVALILSLLLYYIGKWLSKKSKSCKKKKKWWQKLLCWVIWVLKWLSWLVAVLLVALAIYWIVQCVIGFISTL